MTGTAELPERNLYITGTRGNRWALRDSDWKLILSKGKVELFDLAKDPNEKNNLAKTHPDIVTRMKGKLDEHRKRDIPSRGGL